MINSNRLGRPCVPSKITTWQEKGDKPAMCAKQNHHMAGKGGRKGIRILKESLEKDVFRNPPAFE